MIDFKIENDPDYMRIVHITPSFEPAWHLGGVVRSVSQLCRGLARLGHEVTVFTTDRGQEQRLAAPLNQPLELDGLRVYYFKTEFGFKFAYSPGLREACRRIMEFDIVHLTSFWCYPGIPGAREARKQKVPYVVSPRGTFILYSLKQKSLKKWFYLKLVEERNLRGAAAVHYTAEMEREQTAHLGLTNPSFVLPNGLDVREFDDLPDRSIARRELGLPANSPVILFLGRLHPRKGLDFLLKGFARLQRKWPQALLLLAGPDGGSERKLKELSTQLGVSSQVVFPGYVPPTQRNSYLRAADLLALVTHPGENFGNAAVEAMLAGVPVLVSEHVGICREVQADGAGIVVPLKVEAIGRALAEMLADPEKLRARGQAAAVAARRRYDINIVARQMAMAYEDILTGRRSPELSWSDG